MSGTDEKGGGPPPEVEENEDEMLIRSARSMRFGQYRFVGLIIAVSLLVMVLSPLFNRYLEYYEAVVVVPVDGRRVRVLTPDGMPRYKRVSSPDAESWAPGTYLRKDHLAWNPLAITAEELTFDPYAEDPSREPRRALPELYVRYMDEWQGTITSVSYRTLPTRGGRTGEQEVEFRMSIDLDDGSSREMVIPHSLRPEYLPSLGARRGKEELEKFLSDRRIEKQPLTWEPVLMDGDSP